MECHLIYECSLDLPVFDVLEAPFQPAGQPFHWGLDDLVKSTQHPQKVAEPAEFQAPQ